jgi:hypothetical protein
MQLSFLLLLHYFVYWVQFFLAQMVKLYLLALLIRLAKHGKASKNAFECYMLIFKEKIIIVRTSIPIFAIILV